MKAISRLAVAVPLTAWATSALAGASYRLEVSGLACPFCAYGIEKKLSALEGVERVDTHIKDSAVIVTMRDGATLDEAAARKAVQAAGFSLEGYEPVSLGNGEP